MAWAEAKWIVDNLTRKLGQSPNNMRSFSASATTSTSVNLKFLEPADSVENGEVICVVKGVMIRVGTEGYPSSPSEGTLVVDNNVIGAHETVPFSVENLTKGQTYYFSAFPYSTQGVYNMSKDGANRASVSL